MGYNIFHMSCLIKLESAVHSKRDISPAQFSLQRYGDVGGTEEDALVRQFDTPIIEIFHLFRHPRRFIIGIPELDQTRFLSIFLRCCPEALPIPMSHIIEHGVACIKEWPG